MMESIIDTFSVNLKSFTQVEALLVLKFMFDCNFSGSGTLVYDSYYECTKKISGSFGRYGENGFLWTGFLSIGLIIAMNYNVPLEFIGICFVYKMREYIKLNRIISTVHKIKICASCAHTKSQQLISSVKYCICVCRKCARLSDDCNYCRMSNLTHYR